MSLDVKIQRLLIWALFLSEKAWVVDWKGTVPGVWNPYSSILGLHSWDYFPSTLGVLEKASPRKLSFTLTWFSLGAWWPVWNWGLHKGEKGEDKKGDCRAGVRNFGVLWLEYRLVSLPSLLTSFLLNLCYSQVELGKHAGRWGKTRQRMCCHGCIKDGEWEGGWGLWCWAGALGVVILQKS